MKQWNRVLEEIEMKDGWPFGCDESELFATADLCSHGYARLCGGYRQGYVSECRMYRGQLRVGADYIDIEVAR